MYWISNLKCLVSSRKGAIDNAHDKDSRKGWNSPKTTFSILNTRHFYKSNFSIDLNSTTCHPLGDLWDFFLTHYKVQIALIGYGKLTPFLAIHN